MKASTQRLYQDVEFLTSVSPPRNYRNTASLTKVADHIADRMHHSGAAPERQYWRAQGREYQNVLCSYHPEKGRRLVIGAHYDVCGDQPGADDNASAVAGLLELVRLVWHHKPALDYRIDFVAYCLEEPPFFGSQEMGSYVHARSLKQVGAEVIGMVSLEMIGYFSDAPESQPFPSKELAALYPHTANFIMVVGIPRFSEFNQQIHRLMAKDSNIDVQLVDHPATEGLAGLSDQRSYWQFQYPALMINDTTFIRNPNYHQKTDTIDTLDFPKMAEVVNSTYRAIIGL